MPEVGFQELRVQLDIVEAGASGSFEGKSIAHNWRLPSRTSGTAMMIYPSYYEQVEFYRAPPGKILLILKATDTGRAS